MSDVPLGGVTASMRVTTSWQATNPLTGQDYSPTANNSTINKLLSFTLGTTTAGQINQIYSAITTIAASGNATLDLTALTNILGGSCDFVRVKGLLVRLLSTTDDSTNGTACSGITIGNAGSNPAQLFFGAGTATHVIQNGGFYMAGTPGGNGVVVSSTSKELYIVNNDSGVAAAVQVTLFGADA